MNPITSHWWMFVVRGGVSFLLAALLLLAPGWSSTSLLALAFGIFALVDGAGSLAFVRGSHGVPIRSYVARGALGLAAGAVALGTPGLSALALCGLIVGWSIAAGALEMAFGSRAWAVVPRSVGFMVAGMTSIGLGLTLLLFPTESVAVVRGCLVVYLLANGVATMTIGERMHPQVAPAAGGA